MNNEKRRPYLMDRKCSRCLVPLETSERWKDDWLFVTYKCPGCPFRQVVTFSPAELAEREQRTRAKSV